MRRSSPGKLANGGCSADRLKAPAALELLRAAPHCRDEQSERAAALVSGWCDEIANGPAEPVCLQEMPYDPANPKHALRYAGVFGYDALTPQQYADLAGYVVDVGLFVPGILDWNTPEEFLEGNGWPFVQGPPIDDCPDSSCPNHGRERSLRPFAVFQEDHS